MIYDYGDFFCLRIAVSFPLFPWQVKGDGPGRAVKRTVLLLPCLSRHRTLARFFPRYSEPFFGVYDGSYGGEGVFISLFFFLVWVLFYLPAPELGSFFGGFFPPMPPLLNVPSKSFIYDRKLHFALGMDFPFFFFENPLESL